VPRATQLTPLHSSPRLSLTSVGGDKSPSEALDTIDRSFYCLSMTLDKSTEPPKAPPLLEFHLDAHSGVPPYLQLAQQVEGAVRLGMLRPGDQLPTVKDVVAVLAINPNTVLKAYRELEHRGLAAGRPGLGTFVLASALSDRVREYGQLRERLAEWLQDAADAGLSRSDVRALIDAELAVKRSSEIVA
jgi:GntR family transcriptional regulator